MLNVPSSTGHSEVVCEVVCAMARGPPKGAAKRMSAAAAARRHCMMDPLRLQSGLSVQYHKCPVPATVAALQMAVQPADSAADCHGNHSLSYAVAGTHPGLPGACGIRSPESISDRVRHRRWCVRS